MQSPKQTILNISIKPSMPILPSSVHHLTIRAATAVPVVGEPVAEGPVVGGPMIVDPTDVTETAETGEFVAPQGRAGVDRLRQRKRRTWRNGHKLPPRAGSDKICCVSDWGVEPQMEILSLLVILVPCFTNYVY
jgi:hypothetical protein